MLKFRFRVIPRLPRCSHGELLMQCQSSACAELTLCEPDASDQVPQRLRNCLFLRQRVLQEQCRELRSQG
ncbi:hypothetical protein MRX96_047925 [Rhipicephalus microplus]